MSTATKSKDEYIEELHEQRKVMREGNQALRESKELIMAQRDALLAALTEAMNLILNAYAHVSHGGPTRADAEKVIASCKAAISACEKA